MRKSKEPFTDTAQLSELNKEVWQTLEGGSQAPEKMKPESDDTAPPSPSAVVGDEDVSPAPMA